MSQSDIVSNIITALNLSDPELDTSIGTPLRKILDAVAEQIDQATTDPYLLTYQYDIDSKSGGDLDDFCANFGIARLQGQRANGILTFARSTTMAALTSAVIPPGTQAVSLDTPPISAQTTTSAILPLGQASVDVPAQAVLEGPSGNLLANTLKSLVTTLDGISQVTNGAPFTGGTVDETDAQLRARFKATVFRNLAGTDSMFRSIALQTLADPNDSTSQAVTQVNVLGSTKHQVEQIQVASGTATSALTTSAYNIASTVFVGPSISAGSILSQGTDYSVTVNNSTSPATLTITTTGTGSGLVDGIYDLEYDYIPFSSRNDPYGTRWNQGVVNNRIDVIVNGIRGASASDALIQTMHYVNTVVFNNTANSPLLNTRFKSPTGLTPGVGDVLVPCAYGPILGIPSSMSVGGNTYVQGTHYDIVHQDDAFGYAPDSTFGIWWKIISSSGSFTGGTPVPANNTSWSMSYTYNSVPKLVSDDIANWRLLGQDVKVHAGKPAYIVLNFAVVYNSNANPTTTNTNINTALEAYFSNLGFSAAIEKSDLIQVVHNVAGVDNVRLTNSTDNVVTYGIQLVNANGSVISNYNVGGRAIDVYFDERTYPILSTVNITPKARNTFGN